jgi:H+/Cl- antiporter ClcA
MWSQNSKSILKNNLGFLLVSCITIITTLVSIIIIDQTIGLHEYFGRMGDIDLIVMGFVYGGLGSFFTTILLMSNEDFKKRILDPHLSCVGLLYILIILITYKLYNFGLSGLDSVYFVIILYNLIIVTVTNLITIVIIYYRNKLKSE